MPTSPAVQADGRGASVRLPDVSVSVASSQAANLSDSSPAGSAVSAVPEGAALAEDAMGAQGASQSVANDQRETALPSLDVRADAALRMSGAAAEKQNRPRWAGIEKGVAGAAGQARGHAAWQAELRGALRIADARAAVKAARDERRLTQKALTLLPTSVDNGEEE